MEEMSSMRTARPTDPDKSSSQRSHSSKQGTKKGSSKRSANEIEAEAVVISSSLHSFSISTAAAGEQLSPSSHVSTVSTTDVQADEVGFSEKLNLPVNCEKAIVATDVDPSMSSGHTTALGLSTKRIKISDVSAAAERGPCLF